MRARIYNVSRRREFIRRSGGRCGRPKAAMHHARHRTSLLCQQRQPCDPRYGSTRLPRYEAAHQVQPSALQRSYEDHAAAKGQGLGPAITLTTLGEQCMVKAFFALAPSAEASFANSKYEISALAFGLTLDDGAGLRG